MPSDSVPEGARGATSQQAKINPITCCPKLKMTERQTCRVIRGDEVLLGTRGERDRRVKWKRKEGRKGQGNAAERGGEAGRRGGEENEGCKGSRGSAQVPRPSPTPPAFLRQGR